MLLSLHKRILLTTLSAALFLPPWHVHADDNDGPTLESIETAVKAHRASPDDVNAWIALLKRDDTSVPLKERAAWGLGFVGGDDPDTVPTLLKAAEHKGLLVRSAAVNSLIRLRAKPALEILEKVANGDPILALRRDATLGLGLLESDQAIQPLVTLSEDKSPDVKGAAALAMSALQSKKNDFRSALKEMTADPDPGVQERAAKALLIAEGKNAAIRPQLSSSDRDVRLFAALYFLRHGTAGDKAAVQAAADGEADDEVRNVLEQAKTAIEEKRAVKKTATKKKTSGSRKKKTVKHTPR